MRPFVFPRLQEGHKKPHAAVRAAAVALTLIVAGAGTGLLLPPSFGQTGAVDMRPYPGEALLTGSVVEVRIGQGRIRLGVTRMDFPQGKGQEFPAPRPKVVQIPPALQHLLTDLQPGDIIQVTGPNTGAGQVMNARLLALKERKPREEATPAPASANPSTSSPNETQPAVALPEPVSLPAPEPFAFSLGPEESAVPLAPVTDTAKWKLLASPDARATLTPEGQSLRVSVARSNGNYGGVQAALDGLTLNRDTLYTLSFYARADTDARDIYAKARSDGRNELSGSPLRTFRLNKEWQLCQMVFKVSQPTPGGGALQFSMGQQTGHVWLSGVTLTAGTSNLDRSIARTLPTEDEDLIQQIPWRNDLLRAREEAKRLGKPLFIWSMTGNPCGHT